MGALKAREISIPRARLRQRLCVVDGVGRAQRERIALKRRIYNVRGPNHLW